MTLHLQAVTSLKRELLAQLNENEIELATLEAAYADASDAERYRLSNEMAEVINAIDEISAELDSLDEYGFWRDRA